MSLVSCEVFFTPCPTDHHNNLKKRKLRDVKPPVQSHAARRRQGHESTKDI